MLSTKAKEAIKTALAMTIAYAIALSMDWDRPYWASFAVAFVSLATVGLSINRAALRLFGTVIAAVVALLLIAGFAQDRWLFMLAMTPIIGFCCYMMGGAKYQYFWQVCGLVCMIVCFDAGPDPVTAFDTAVIRVQQTGMGIFVYSLVALFVWPVQSGAQFEAIARDLATTQHDLYTAYRGLLAGDESQATGASQLRALQAQQQARFSLLLNAAYSDSQEVRERRRQWRQYQRNVQSLATAMERWRECFAEVKSMDLQRLLPDLKTCMEALDTRLAEVAPMLAGEAPQSRTDATELSVDNKAADELPHFGRAVVVVFYRRMLDLEKISRAVFGGLSEIRGFGPEQAITEPARPPVRFLPDPDRIACTARFLVVVWIAYLALIYVEGWPGGPGFVGMSGALGIALVNAPQVPLSKLVAPITSGALLAGVLYFLVMPHLSSFLELGVMIFAVTFAFCYFFAASQQALGRAFGLALFGVIASISNEQTYSFMVFSTTVLMFATLLPLLALTLYFPVSWRPERVFLRQLTRFFRSCDHLMSVMQQAGDEPPNHMDRWRRAFHLQEVITLPKKLGTWAPHIAPAALAGTPPQQVQSLVAGLGDLSLRMQAMVEASTEEKSETLIDALQADIQDWSASVRDTFQRLSDDPATAEASEFRSGSDGGVERLEHRIEDAIERSSAAEIGPMVSEGFYRQLGACRDVSEALLSYADRSSCIDWSDWRKERF